VRTSNRTFDRPSYESLSIVTTVKSRAYYGLPICLCVNLLKITNFLICCWEDNIKMDLIYIYIYILRVLGCMELAQNRLKGGDYVLAVFKLQILLP
jgi:hypothetical protein